MSPSPVLPLRDPPTAAVPRAAALAPTGEAPTAAASACRDPLDRAAVCQGPGDRAAARDAL
ncbi:hypothetical protein [Streptomyces nigra]|uniref:hypothetical protein n=1 Tax=Streptomyces nigra TaxID=1827580 RepID=UPI0036802FBA